MATADITIQGKISKVGFIEDGFATNFADFQRADFNFLGFFSYARAKR